MNCRQAAHANLHVLWVFSMNSLPAEDEPPGSTSTVTLFLCCFDVLDVSCDAP